MLWSALLVFIVALTYRVIINRGQTWGTPDEKVYSDHAHSWRVGKVYCKAVQEFTTKQNLEVPPTRYGFFAICSALVYVLKTRKCFQVVTWVAATSGALSALVAYQITHDLVSSLLVASSPLSLMLSRRALQDTFGTLTIILAVWAIQSQNAWFLGIALAWAVASREALLLYIPALIVAWYVKTGDWLIGSSTSILGVALAVFMFYLLGGRDLVGVLRKLRLSTDYIRRFQSGMPHRVLVDLALISPVTTLVACIVCLREPLWLVSFVSIALLTHSLVNPKNVRFLLAVDIGVRMLCSDLPGPWPWIVLGIGGIADLCLYKVIGHSKDPVTYNLVVQTNMYQEK
jgi:hypothetical protein